MNDMTRRNDPFDLLGRFGDLFERDPFLSPARGAREWQPPVDITETDASFRFQMDVPGLKADDLDVELHEGVLSVRGSRQSEQREQDKGYLRIERQQGSFVRQFRVPASVKAEDLKASVNDGVLSIEVPKGSTQVSRKVPIG